MRLSASCLLLLALIQQACALLVTPHPCAWYAPRSEVSRSSSPLMLAKRKGKASRDGEVSRGSSTPGDTPPPAAAPQPVDLDVEAAMAQAEVAAAEAAAAKARLAAARARAAIAAKQQPTEASPVAQVAPETPSVMVPPDVPFPVAGPADVPGGASFDEKGAIIRDEPKLTLPSFESYSRGAPKPLPKLNEFVGKSYESKLPGINQGAKYVMPGEEKKDEKPLFEKLIFNGTWAGILILVLIEIFINTPAFQAVKPAILSFLGSD